MADAVSLLERHLSASPSDFAVQISLLDILRDQGIDLAKERLDKFIEGQPGSIDLRELRVKQLLADGETEQAKAELNWIVDNIAEASTQRKARALLARVFYGEGDSGLAYRSVEEILVEDRFNEPALLARAGFLIDEEQVEAAISDLRIVLRNNSESEEALLLLGQAYMANGSDQLADDAFREILEINPSNVNAAIPVAEALIGQSNFSRSEQVISAALMRYPDHPVLLSMLAQVNMMKRDWAASEGVVDQLISKSGVSAYTEFLSGRIYLGQSKFELARKKFKAALELQADFARALEGLVSSYIQPGNERELLAYLKGFNLEHPTVMPVYGILSRLARAGGDSKMEEKVYSGWISHR